MARPTKVKGANIMWKKILGWILIVWGGGGTLLDLIVLELGTGAFFLPRFFIEIGMLAAGICLVKKAKKKGYRH